MINHLQCIICHINALYEQVWSSNSHFTQDIFFCLLSNWVQPMVTIFVVDSTRFVRDIESRYIESIVMGKRIFLPRKFHTTDTNVGLILVWILHFDTIFHMYWWKHYVGVTMVFTVFNLPCTDTETKTLSFWRNFRHWLHWKLSKWQLPVQPAMKIPSK